MRIHFINILRKNKMSSYALSHILRLQDRDKLKFILRLTLFLQLFFGRISINVNMKEYPYIY